jgi:hypothetical protein
MILLALSVPAFPESESELVSDLHGPFDTILKEYVDEGIVDYAGLKKNEADLDRYLKALDLANPSVLDRNGRLAFWINAYNAFTLKLILNHYPGIGSIKEISSGKRWKARVWSVNGEFYSLDDIEHKILRKLDEPRIHFAIVCASYSCPDLRSEAYLPDRLEEQLEDASHRFLADINKGLHFVEEEGVIWGTNYNLYLSSIFDWFEEDFEKASVSVVDFVLLYAPDKAKEFIRIHRDELNVRHLDYDWRLNGR